MWLLSDLTLWIITINKMNIKHVQSGSIWTKLALAQYALSLGLGIYGNSRTKFSSDFTYNVSPNGFKHDLPAVLEIPFRGLCEPGVRNRVVAVGQGPHPLALWGLLSPSHRAQLLPLLLRRVSGHPR